MRRRQSEKAHDSFLGWICYEEDNLRRHMILFLVQYAMNLVSKLSKAKATRVTASNSTEIYRTFRHDESKKVEFDNISNYTNHSAMINLKKKLNLISFQLAP